MNKIDEFFKNKYDNDKLSDEGWNRPADQLWENVLPHLPQKKSRKKVLLLLFGFISISSLLYLNYNYKKVGSLLLNDLVVSNSSTNHADVISSTPVDLELLDSNSSNLEFKNIKYRPAEKINSNELKINSNRNILSELNIAKSGVVNDDLESYNSEMKQNSTGKFSLSIINDKRISLSDNEKVKKPNVSFVDNDFRNIDSPIQGLSSKLGLGVVPSENENLFDLVKTEVLVEHFLPSKELSSFNFLSSNHKYLGSIQPQIVKRNRPDYEVGIAHSLTFFSLFNFIDPSNIDIDPGILIENARYRNINLKYKKWINKHISISSAIVYSDLQIGLCFDNDIIYEKDMLDILINEEYGDAVKRARPNKELGDIMITLKDNVTLEEGEALNIRGKVDLNLKAYQVPLYFNYHLYTRKTDYFIGLGTSLDFVYFSENLKQFNLSRGDVQISENEIYSVREENYIDYTFNFRTGFRRDITNNIKFGLDLKIDLLEPIFSSLDFGIYYRFYNAK